MAKFGTNTENPTTIINFQKERTLREISRLVSKIETYELSYAECLERRLRLRLRHHERCRP